MEKKSNAEKNRCQQDSLLNHLIHPKPSQTDPDGMYTGLPMEYGETPVQDADDL